MDLKWAFIFIGVAIKIHIHHTLLQWTINLEAHKWWSCKRLKSFLHEVLCYLFFFLLFLNGKFYVIWTYLIKYLNKSISSTTILKWFFSLKVMVIMHELYYFYKKKNLSYSTNTFNTSFTSRVKSVFPILWNWYK